MKVNDVKMRDLIKVLCKHRPELANDDKRLIATVWYLEGWEDPNLYEHLKTVSSPETIRRTRAKLAEEGEIKVSEEVAKARREEEQQVRKSLKGE